MRSRNDTGSFFADYEDLPTRHKQLVDAMCKDKQVLCFLLLCIAKEVYEGGFKTKQEVDDLFNEIFPEKTEEEIRARMNEEWLKEKKKGRRNNEK